jgi:putative endonuclease
MHYVYFIQSTKNGKIYCGRTEKEPLERVKDHNQGSNAYTRANTPFILKYYEKYHCKKDAAEREKFYKSGFGRKIRDLILSSASARGGSASG